MPDQEFYLDPNGGWAHADEDCTAHEFQDATVIAQGTPINGFKWCEQCVDEAPPMKKYGWAFVLPFWKKRRKEVWLILDDGHREYWWYEGKRYLGTCFSWKRLIRDLYNRCIKWPRFYRNFDARAEAHWQKYPDLRPWHPSAWVMKGGRWN